MTSLSRLRILDTVPEFKSSEEKDVNLWFKHMGSKVLRALNVAEVLQLGSGLSCPPLLLEARIWLRNSPISIRKFRTKKQVIISVQLFRFETRMKSGKIECNASKFVMRRLFDPIDSDCLISSTCLAVSTDNKMSLLSARYS